MPKKEAGAGAAEVPGFDSAMIVASQRKNLDALQQANQVALEGAHAVLQRQCEIGRAVMDEVSAVFGTLGQPSATPEEWIVRQVETSKKALEISLANARELARLMTKVNTDALDVLTHRISESLDEVRDYAKKRTDG
jgi:phasin family protein